VIPARLLQRGVLLRNRLWSWRHPEPKVLLRRRHQSLPHWIIQDVSDLLIKLLRNAQHAIERLLLPNSSWPAELPVDHMRGSSLDGFGDSREGKYLCPIRIYEGGKNHVDMIGHNNKGPEIYCPGVCPNACVHNEASRPVWQYPSLVGAERQEMGFAIALEVRQITTIEG